MDVNEMPGQVTNESGDKSQETEGSVNALQSGDTCFFFCKKPGHMKSDCRKYDDWKKENPIWKTRSSSRRMLSFYNFGKEGHISRGE